MTDESAFERLRRAASSSGAPSARNLLVTVFGDALLPHGSDIAVSVRSLSELLVPFEVSERLVRTSLTRLVNDGLLTTQRAGRRSFYRVAETALELFQRADARIYGSRRRNWDGSWTLVVLDGAEATPAARARLRQELTWAGLGTVAPNVMASPVVPAGEAAEIVGRVEGFRHVIVSRSTVVEGAGIIDRDELARRCSPLDEVAGRYDQFVRDFHGFDRSSLEGIDPPEAFKLRILLVATYRRIVLTDPLLPAELLPLGWAGAAARAMAADVYGAVAEPSERHLAAVAELDAGSLVPDSDWLHGRFVVE